MAHRMQAVWMRGGTSKGLFLHAADLPTDIAERDRVLLRVMGSPDPHGRQLDGMGGGISSLSKVAIIAPSKRTDADVDFTFLQVSVDRAAVDASSTCGNLTAAVGPFAVDEGLVRVIDGQTLVRIFNTNSGQRIEARFDVRDGHPVETGSTRIAGVPYAGGAIELRFLDPAGSSTGSLLPANSPTIVLDGRQVSLVDASAFCVFVSAADFGLTGTESPAALEARPDLLASLEALRRAAAVTAGLCRSTAEAPLATPRVALLAAPTAYESSDGTETPAEAYDISMRMISMGRPHRAVTATGAMCLAAAVKIDGSLPSRVYNGGAHRLRIGHPAGITQVAADIVRVQEGDQLRWTGITRTARRIMEGAVLLPRT